MTDDPKTPRERYEAEVEALFWQMVRKDRRRLTDVTADDDLDTKTEDMLANPHGMDGR